eukprot:5791659-Heterocapsa_arctica.AAC.1
MLHLGVLNAEVCSIAWGVQFLQVNTPLNALDGFKAFRPKDLDFSSSGPVLQLHSQSCTAPYNANMRRVSPTYEPQMRSERRRLMQSVGKLPAFFPRKQG